MTFLSLDTHRPNLFEIGQPHQHFLHPVHFERAHAAVDGRRKQPCFARFMIRVQFWTGTGGSQPIDAPLFLIIPIFE